MKRKLLALAVLTASLPALAHTVKISDTTDLKLFGEFAAQHQTSHSKTNGDDSYARLGVQGTHKISDTLSAVGLLQGEYSLGKSTGDNGVSARLGWAGLKSGDFQVTYGRQEGVNKLTRNMSDVLAGFGGDSAIVGDDNWFNGISNNLLSAQYQANGITLQAQYLAKSDSKKDEAYYPNENKLHGQGYAFGAVYDAGMFKFGTTFSGGQNVNPNNGKMRSVTVGLGIDTSFAYFGASYQNSQNHTFKDGHFLRESEGYELAANFKTGFGLTPSIGYNYAEGKEENDKGHYQVVNYISVGAKYDFTANVQGKVAYQFNMVDENKFNAHTDDQVKVGLSYTF